MIARSLRRFGSTSLFLALAVLPSRATVQNVEVGNNYFSPANINVVAGDVVHWYWVAGSHSTTSGSNCTPDGLWDAPINQGNQTFDYTFTTPGTFNYYCIPHCTMNMIGVVTVQASSGVTPSAPATRPPLVLRALPNPFPASTALSFDLAQSGTVRVAVFNAGGRWIATLANGPFSAGRHTLKWNGRSGAGSEAPAGVYYARSWSSRGRTTATLVKLR